MFVNFIFRKNSKERDCNYKSSCLESLYCCWKDHFLIYSNIFIIYCSAAGHPCRGGTVTGQGSPGIRTQVRGCITVWHWHKTLRRMTKFELRLRHLFWVNICMFYNVCIQQRHNYTMSVWKDVAHGITVSELCSHAIIWRGQIWPSTLLLSG